MKGAHFGGLSLSSSSAPIHPPSSRTSRSYTKVQAIRSWPTPTMVSQVRCFHGLAGFYHCFVPNFSTNAAPLNEMTKKGVTFHWGKSQEDAFNLLKDKLTHSPLLQLPDFGIGGVLMQENKHVAYFSDKLSGPVLNYSTYDKELAVLKKNLKMWEECLPHVEFAYNRAVHSTTKVVYGLNPRAPIDLLPLPTSERVHHGAKERADFILKLHETTKENIKKMNERYKDAGDKGRKEVKLEPGDLVWLHLRKDCFPDLKMSKLMPRADGPLKIIEKIKLQCL
ncbi:hypothetical protein U9M48_031334 [Paspalum notatum var. saurae]|uniref:Reverse transcriptase/retrotransposon-derived protein RNase H-like domain-containing protein n=1 Tax=Paspalum notatum var. saurae TaxID=547442 RepID=A0AAQ3U2E9_PASNO